jgi:hypothetical protein
LSVEDVYEKLHSLQIKMDENLPKYRELLEVLDAGNAQSIVCPKHKSNMQVLAKLQGDLSDQFTKFVTMVLGVKRLKPITDGQMKVLRHIIRSKVDYYHENMSLFRYLQRQLESVVPPESLVAIQDFVDKSAINSCYVSVKQLLFEIIHICDKHHLETELPVMLVPLEKVSEQDLQSCVTDPWPEHEKAVNELLRQQLASHRFIRRMPSYRCPPNVILSIVMERILAVLQQVLLQLVTKASDSRFEATKLALRKTVHDVQSHCSRYNDWIVLDQVAKSVPRP